VILAVSFERLAGAGAIAGGCGDRLRQRMRAIGGFGGADRTPSCNGRYTRGIDLPSLNLMQVKDLTTEELKALIRETVLETLEDVLDDPDIGKTLRPELRQQLLESRQHRTTGHKGIPAAEVAQRFGLTWQ
jgi:hypothetical protein